MTECFFKFPCSVSCLSFHLRRACLSLLSLLCFCSVVHRTVYTSARSCLSARTIHMWTRMWLKIPRLCRPPKIIHIITISCMLAHERSTPLTLTPSSLILSSRTKSQVKLPINKSPVLLRQEEESGSLAKTTSPTLPYQQRRVRRPTRRWKPLKARLGQDEISTCAWQNANRSDGESWKMLK